MEAFLLKNAFLAEIKPLHFVGLYKQLFKLDLHFPHFPSTKNYRVAIFRGNTEINLGANLCSISEVDEFVEVMFETLEGLLSQSNCITNSVTQEKSSNLTNVAFQVLSVQQQNDLNISFDHSFSQIEITGFESNSMHSLVLHRTTGLQFKVTKHTLPELAVSEVFKRQTTLQRHVQVFVNMLDQLEEFYNNLNTIDELCYVVLPVQIDTKTTYRVFKYNQKVFFKISLHPLQPSAVDIVFIGPTRQVAELRGKYDEKQDEWDPECNVYTNLLRIFDIIAFPMRPTEQTENGTNNDENCGICMAYRDEHSRIPIISCDNDKCSLIFHIRCLKEWFSMQRESKQFFSISIGHCPYCKHKMSSSFDDMIMLSA
uniref:RING-type domain-containing protein n=1 Tax=Anopheles atroparvus TaxID=41427 RepID=A0A182JMK0_ANOAO